MDKGLQPEGAKVHSEASEVLEYFPATQVTQDPDDEYVPGLHVAEIRIGWLRKGWWERF